MSILTSGAWTGGLPFAICTSICHSTVTICSALYFLIDISSFPYRFFQR